MYWKIASIYLSIYLSICIYLSSTVFGSSLLEAGESLKQMADLKYALDDNVKQNFLEPLHHLQSKDLKEVGFIYPSIYLSIYDTSLLTLGLLVKGGRHLTFEWHLTLE